MLKIHEFCEFLNSNRSQHLKHLKFSHFARPLTAQDKLNLFHALGHFNLHTLIWDCDPSSSPQDGILPNELGELIKQCKSLKRFDYHIGLDAYFDTQELIHLPSPVSPLPKNVRCVESRKAETQLYLGVFIDSNLSIQIHPNQKEFFNILQELTQVAKGLLDLTLFWSVCE